MTRFMMALMGLLMITGAAQAQRATTPPVTPAVEDAVGQPTRSQAQPVQPLGVAQPNVVEAEQIFCAEIRDIFMARGGLAFNCNPQDPEENVIAVFDGGTAPGGISAAMTMLTWYREHDKGVILRYQPDPDNPICAQVSYSGSYDCVSVISFGGY